MVVSNSPNTTVARTETILSASDSDNVPWNHGALNGTCLFFTRMGRFRPSLLVLDKGNGLRDHDSRCPP